MTGANGDAKKDDNSVKSDKGCHSKNKPKTRKHKKKARRTKTSASGLCNMATPHVKIKDSDDKDSEDDGDDIDQEINPTTSTQKKKSKKETPRKKKKGCRNPVLRCGRIPGEAARVVLDGGTEFEVIGRVRW